MRRLAIALVWLLAAATVAHAAPAVSMAVAADGGLTLELGGKTVASGTWRLRQDSYLPCKAVAQFDSGRATVNRGIQPSATHATVHQEYPGGVSADFKLDLRGEDLSIAAHVVNGDPVRTLKPIAFDGLVFHFDPARPITGQMPNWFWTYIQARGAELFHPSIMSPLGVWWAGDGTFAFAVHSESEFDRTECVSATWMGHDGVIPPECEPNLYTDRPVPPGSSVDVTVSFRVTADGSIAHLIAPYKAVYDRHFPLPTYTPNDGLVGQNAEVGQNLITRRNPLGYAGDYRFDSAVGTAMYVRRTVPLLKQAGGIGMIFWAPGGFNPPMYNPDFDVFPPQVQPNIPKLVKGFHDAGLRVGLCARPGEEVARIAGKATGTYRLSADNAEQMKVDVGRFRHAIDMGFDMFYLDTFGGDGLNDVRILQQIRAAVGPDVLLYTENCTDVSLAYAGRYCEWTRHGDIRWDSMPQYQALKLLAPAATWLCVSEQDSPIPPSFAELGLTPIVGDPGLARVTRPWVPPSQR